jgi:diguanylate cyclase (GGDEF)-like protein
MKKSINKIFANLSALLVLLTLLLFVSAFLILEQNFSFEKTKILKEQKKIVASLTHLDKNDINTAMIQFNGKSTQLHHLISNLRSHYTYDFTSQYILDTQDEYFTDLQKLAELIVAFNEKASLYYTKEELTQEEELARKADLQQAFYNVNVQINTLLLKDSDYNQDKAEIIQYIIVATFIIMLLTVLWYRKRLKVIYQDIFFLYSIEGNKKDYTIFSEEVDAIALRMKRKPSVSDNPAMIDPLTEINNNKGMYTSYAEKKGMKDGNFTSVTVLEIDNFSKTNRAYSQEFAQAVLKKIAFTISLHQQATDVVARTDYNQFTIILSRPSKEQSFKDVDIIRQSISELHFKDANREDIKITVTGGFLVKPNSTPLEEAVKQTKEILHYAQQHGTNKIAQKRDMAEHEL